MSKVDYDEYKRLKVLAAILPAALAKGMTLSAIEDLAARGANDGTFLISSSSEFLGPPASDFVEQWSQKPEGAHLFQSTDADKSALVFGMSREKFDKLKPEAKLRLANEHHQPSKDKRRE